MEERLLAMMDNYKLRKPSARSWQVLIQSFSTARPAEGARSRPDAAADPAAVVLPGSPPLADQLDTMATYAVGVSALPINMATIVPPAHERCLDVHPWTVDAPATMTTLISQGVDGACSPTSPTSSTPCSASAPAVDGRSRAVRPRCTARA